MAGLPGSRAFPFSSRGIAVRLFVTCWLIYALHFASNTVREIYLALAIGDHLSFRVDDYANMHPDLFEKKGYGWHIGANPGASMIAAIPYALARPIIDPIVERINLGRKQAGLNMPPTYDSPWPMAREFYQQAWNRGYDVKFGLAAFVMQAFCMAPISALGVLAMFFACREIFLSDRTALWLAILYAFGTPVFFRTGFLNHNLMIAHFSFAGFLLLWNPRETVRLSTRVRLLLAGLCGGLSLLLDYSGAVVLLGLFAYALCKGRQELRRLGDSSLAGWIRLASWYVLGTLAPVFLLWFYQWSSFGNPFYPGQHWMPPVEWIDLGYQGYTLPQLDLLAILLFDYRFGLFTTCPLFLLALAAPFVRHSIKALGKAELVLLLGLPLALLLFFGGVQYTRLQFNTGIRYLAPVFPYLFAAAAVVLVKLPRSAIYFIEVLSIAFAWCLAMYRDVELGLGLAEPVLQILFFGFQLPVLTVLSRMGRQYGDYFGNGVSPIPLFLLAGLVLYGLWSRRFWSSKAAQ